MDILKELLHPYAPVVWKALIGYCIVLLAIFADLWSGIKKSKKNGTYKRSDPSISSRWWKKAFFPFVHTYGLDRTLDKIRKRYNLLIVFSMIDILLIICEFYNSMIPYVTIIASVVMCLVEVKSILEKDEDKGRYIEAARTATEIWKGFDKDEFAETIIKKINDKQNGS